MTRSSLAKIFPTSRDRARDCAQRLAGLAAADDGRGVQMHEFFRASHRASLVSASKDRLAEGPWEAALRRDGARSARGAGAAADGAVRDAGGVHGGCGGCFFAVLFISSVYGS
jgi:hypothetical protein